MAYTLLGNEPPRTTLGGLYRNRISVRFCDFYRHVACWKFVNPRTYQVVIFAGRGFTVIATDILYSRCIKGLGCLSPV
jgi:hypothetical protein